MSGREKKGCTETSPMVLNCFEASVMNREVSPPPDNSYREHCLSIKESLRHQRKPTRPRSNATAVRKTKINSQSKLTLPVRPAPSVPPPYTTDTPSSILVSNHCMSSTLLGDADISDATTSGPLSDSVKSIKMESFEDLDSNSKVCALCNHGIETRMMQGSLTKYDPTPDFRPFEIYYNRMQSQKEKEPDIVLEEPPVVVRRGPGRPPGKGRKKGTAINGFSVFNADPKLPLDMSLFGTVKERDIDELFEPTGHTWCHTCCAIWSEGVQQVENCVKYVDKTVFQAMFEKCNHCHNYGASVACIEESCTSKFHYTCAASAGCFQDVKTKTVLCPNHLTKAEELVGEDARCSICDDAGDIASQLFCCNCWRHYHSKCLQPEVDPIPCVRMGWHCPECKICSDCGRSGDDSKMLVCDICDKGYHIYCLKPPVATIPKNGWKCENCRRCQDCGSMTPGSGATSRWHLNYTVCDSCYQQRNKGFYCPLCGRAYRQFTDVPMVQCANCEKSVHLECDSTAQDIIPYKCVNCRMLFKEEVQVITNDEKPTFDDKPCFDQDHILSTGQDPASEVMLSSTSDPSLSASLDLPINIELEPNVAMDCTVESVDSYELVEKLPFDEEMEVEAKGDEDFSPSQFPDPLTPRPSISKRTSVTPAKSIAKRKLASRKPRQPGSSGRKKVRYSKAGRPTSKVKNKPGPQPTPEKENENKSSNGDV